MDTFLLISIEVWFNLISNVNLNATRLEMPDYTN